MDLSELELDRTVLDQVKPVALFSYKAQGRFF
jgi:hypothetical protein